MVKGCYLYGRKWWNLHRTWIGPARMVMRRRSKFDVGWQDWALALALGALVLLLLALALAAWGGWSHQRDVARAMASPPKELSKH